MRCLPGVLIASILVFATGGNCRADAPLHERIDELISASAADRPVAALTDDSEFLRRVWLDFAGRIPSAETVTAFVADTSADKRGRVIDELLAADTWPERMTDQFHIMLMERRGEDDGWNAWLQQSFKDGKPWDQLVRELLDPDGDNEATRGAAFFMTKRLEKYGQNPTDYPGLVRDVGRLFLGMDLQCAECHNHLFIEDYKQVDFKGLFTVYQNAFIRGDVKFPAIGEKAMTAKLEFVSVFDPTQAATGPRIPGGRDFEIPELKPADPKQPKPKTAPSRPDWSALKIIADELTSRENRQFALNTVNRVWFSLMGRGIVHPLDVHHSANPPSHPELLDALADALVASDFNIKSLQKEIALSNAYQRSTRLPGADATPPPETFLVGIERRLSAEQLMWSMLAATGQTDMISVEPPAETEEAAATTDASVSDKPSTELPALPEIRTAFMAALANDAREPEEVVASTVKSALFWRNSDVVQRLVLRRQDNLLDRLASIDDHDALTNELFLNVLSRAPTPDEQAAVTEFLASLPDDKDVALRDVAWALLTSIEFYVNH